MKFPLIDWKGVVPTGQEHPGAFGAKRKHDWHTGVDLYVSGSALVLAMESGYVVAVEDFTGPKAESPWWLPTQSILISGESGVICYGEVSAIAMTVGDMVMEGQCIGYVIPVLKEDKEPRQDIQGHSRHMLHLELYKSGTTKSVWWKTSEDEKPENLLDPTQILLDALS